MKLYGELMSKYGGMAGIRDAESLSSCLVQPYQAVFGIECYPTLHHKAAALGFFLASNHPFIDGNKRIAYGALEAFLMMNGHELLVDVNEAEQVMLKVASGELSIEGFTDWVGQKMIQLCTHRPV